MDQGEVSLDDPLSTWLPDLPKADKITVKNLLNMTSGYADYVYQPSLQKDYYGDPSSSGPMNNSSTSVSPRRCCSSRGPTGPTPHTNYVLLGEVLGRSRASPWPM